MTKRLPLLVAAGLAALLSVPASYAVLRSYDVLFKSEPDPARIVWSAHIAMFWRLGIGGYTAGLVTVLVFTLASRSFSLATRVTAVLVPVVGAMIAIQGAFLP